MISLAKIRSAGGAADYFSRDNFHSSADDTEQHSEWWGKGAEQLGLSGAVTKDALQAVLDGHLPDGTRLGGDHRPGFELTFTPPKSISLLALLGGDERLLQAHREAVKATLAWAQKHLAQTRIAVAGSTVKIQTDNLLVALIEHDTNRNQEPNLHTHAIIANVTQGQDGKWRTLVNDQLWRRSALLGSIYHADLRRKVQGLGYTTAPHGKHGTFEIAGMARAVIEAYSTRSQEINEAHTALERQTPATRDAMALKTRRRKPLLVDRSDLLADWQTQANCLGVDFTAMVAVARKEAAPDQTPWSQITRPLSRLGDRAATFLQLILRQIEGRPEDPLVPEKPGIMTPDQLAAAHAVASAVRHLSEREAAWKAQDILKAALDLHLPVDAAAIEKRIKALKAAGLLTPGNHRHPDMLTTPEAMDLETRILGHVRDGLGRSYSVLPPSEAGRRAQAASEATLGHPLNPGQEAAARQILASSNRYVGVQGVPGAGKTAMLKAISLVLKDEGHTVLGLGHQNRLVRLLERETGIASQTIRSFIAQHRALLAGKARPDEITALQARFRSAFLLVDEASMVSNADTLALMQIADKLGVQRVALVGDKRQIGSIEAGKPFEVLQEARLPTAEMPENVRQRPLDLRKAAQAAHEGRIGEAIAILRPVMQETPDPAAAAAEAWLALPVAERDRTALYASGRTIRAQLNGAIQEGLLGEGTLKGLGQEFAVLDRLALTREEERYIHVYKPGQRIEFARTLGAADIQRGTWGTITAVDADKGKLTLITDEGRTRTFFPQKLALNRTRESVRLYEIKPVRLYEGDQIRWTDNDKDRGLLNADLARVLRISSEGVLIRTTAGQHVLLKPDDPMLKRLDLAYALNAHMAQGLTSDKAIAVMVSHERNLSNERLFLVTITRVRDGLSFMTDSIDRLTRQLARTPGDKTSALEVTGRIEPVQTPAGVRQAPAPTPASGEAPRRTPELDLG